MLATRRGTKCQLKSELGKQRCRMHGGLSTGPTSTEGKARIAEAQRKRWAARRADHGSGT
ncbi:HGGxSTG domain-containing protein [uncultured Paracoccus sp.]|uniref:HGGxSTG domain-containing protein n=1 Tax=uncultured Paracoccus sp. TaxID=189685 RepID=UPI0034583395